MYNLSALLGVTSHLHAAGREAVGLGTKVTEQKSTPEGGQKRDT